MSRQRKYWNRKRRSAAGNPNPSLAELRVLGRLLKKHGNESGERIAELAIDAVREDVRHRRALADLDRRAVAEVQRAIAERSEP